METLNLLSNQKSSIKKLTKNSKLYKTIIQAILDKKGDNIVSLDLKKISESVADFFIICSASNAPQIKAIAENIEWEVEEKCNERVYKKEGLQSSQWILLDYVSVVVHVMHTTSRQFYKLEDMWSDANAEHYS